jgi:hypothetical protein
MGNTICEPVRNIAINLLQSNDQKLKELKDLFQSMEYNMVRSYQKIKEDVVSIENRMELLEKSQKISQINNNFDSTNTNYYQLFTKLFDIILTLCAIFLLIINNAVSIVKSIFYSCPRVIVFLLFTYILLYNYFSIKDAKLFAVQFFQKLPANNTF